MANSKVLVVEDDLTLLDVLKYNISKEGYTVLTASDGEKALEVARKEQPEVIILDVMLPKLSGMEVCRILRSEMTVPILMLTARTEEIDRVLGLELGADDYMTKPFSVRELLARIRAMLRRTDMLRQEMTDTRGNSPFIIKSAGLELDINRHMVSLDGRIIDLSPLEFELLSFLVKNMGRVFSRDQLLDKVWGYDYAGDTRTVDVHVRWLRQKIEMDPASPRHLLTVRGIGYKFEQ